MNTKVTINVLTILILFGLTSLTKDLLADPSEQEQSTSTQNNDNLWTRDKLLGDTGSVRSTLGE